MDVEERGGACGRAWSGKRHAGKSERAAVRAGITGKGGPIILGLLEIIGLFGVCLASSLHRRFVAGGGGCVGGKGRWGGARG